MFLREHCRGCFSFTLRWFSVNLRYFIETTETVRFEEKRKTNRFDSSLFSFSFRKQPNQSRSQSSFGFGTFPVPRPIPMEPVIPVQNQRDAPYRYQAPVAPPAPYQSPFNNHSVDPFRQNSFVNPAMISPYDPRPALPLHQQNLPPRNQFYSPTYSEDYYPNRNMYTTNNRPVETTHYRQDSAGFELFDHLDNYYLQQNSPDFIQTTSY